MLKIGKDSLKVSANPGISLVRSCGATFGGWPALGAPSPQRTTPGKFSKINEGEHPAPRTKTYQEARPCVPSLRRLGKFKLIQALCGAGEGLPLLTSPLARQSVPGGLPEGGNRDIPRRLAFALSSVGRWWPWAWYPSIRSSTNPRQVTARTGLPGYSRRINDDNGGNSNI